MCRSTKKLSSVKTISVMTVRMTAEPTTIPEPALAARRARFSSYIRRLRPDAAAPNSREHGQDDENPDNRRHRDQEIPQPRDAFCLLSGHIQDVLRALAAREEKRGRSGSTAPIVGRSRHCGAVAAGGMVPPEGGCGGVEDFGCLRLQVIGAAGRGFLGVSPAIERTYAAICQICSCGILPRKDGMPFGRPSDIVAKMLRMSLP